MVKTIHILSRNSWEVMDCAAVAYYAAESVQSSSESLCGEVVCPSKECVLNVPGGLLAARMAAC